MRVGGIKGRRVSGKRMSGEMRCREDEGMTGGDVKVHRVLVCFTFPPHGSIGREPASWRD